MRRLLSLVLILLFIPALAAAGEEGGEGKKGAGKPKPFLPIASLSVSMRRPKGGWGVLTIETGLNIPAEDLRVRAEQSIPRLRAAYTQALIGYVNLIRPGAPPNVDLLALQLQQATDKTLGKKGAQLLLGGVTLN